MKRKNDAAANGSSKKRAISDEEAHKNFRKGLFSSDVLQSYTKEYAASEPYVYSSSLQFFQVANMYAYFC